ncbi:MAG: DUF2924 domain-containing protein [Methylocella sp.]
MIASLSTIARAITGTAWSGPRFFWLRAKNGAAGRYHRCLAGHDSGRATRNGRSKT